MSIEMRMRHLKLLITALTLFIIAASALGQEAGKAKDESDVARISARDAKEAYDKKSAVFVDARSIEAYKIEHVKSALHIPVSDNPDLKSLPKDKKIIVYCS